MSGSSKMFKGERKVVSAPEASLSVNQMYTQLLDIININREAKGRGQDKPFRVELESMANKLAGGIFSPLEKNRSRDKLLDARADIHWVREELVNQFPNNYREQFRQDPHSRVPENASLDVVRIWNAAQFLGRLIAGIEAMPAVEGEYCPPLVPLSPSLAKRSG